jgi:hypothetical protein
MSLENLELSSNLSFKPIEFETSSSCDSFDAHPVSPIEIFRDQILMDDENADMADGHLLSVRRANPIGASRESFEGNGEGIEHNLITPFPFSPCPSKEELEERDMLTTSLGWEPRLEVVLKGDRGEQTMVQVDFSRFFDLHNSIEIMECDDFSLSTQDANSISDDLGNISKDPASFWEESFAVTQSSLVSLSSSDQSG